MAAIGLSGYAGSGKTAAANYIEQAYGYQRRHIATTLRSMLKVLLEQYGMDEFTIHRYLEGDLKEDVIPCLGVTSRHAQITIGTEWGRDLINPDIWANAWAAGIKAGEAVMNDSVRFPNEEKAIQDKEGSFTIMIVRPGKGPAAFIGGPLKQKIGRWLYQTFGIMHFVHPSERIDLLKPDYVITNNGTLDDLYWEIDGIMAEEQIPPVAIADAA